MARQWERAGQSYLLFAWRVVRCPRARMHKQPRHLHLAHSGEGFRVAFPSRPKMVDLGAMMYARARTVSRREI